MEATFRQAEPADVDLLLTFMQHYYTFDHIPFDAAAMRPPLERLVGDEALGRVWLIQVDDQPVGYVTLTFGYDVEFGGRQATVTDLYLDAAYRRQGLGWQTLAFIEATCRALGIRAFELQVERTNSAAQRLYERFGMTAHDRIPMSKWITSAWTLRPAKPSDAPALTQCVAAAYRHYIPRIGKPPGPMLADYAEEIARHQVWVVEEHGHIVGGLVLVPYQDYILLDNIAVHPHHQGRGIGRALLVHADTEALAQGYSELRLYTHATMTENIALYSRIGWVETHRGQQDGYDRVFMRKRLAVNG